MPESRDDPARKLSSADLVAVDLFRRERRTAVLAILFTDIVGSTEATEQLGEERYSRIRRVHDDLFLHLIAQVDAGTVVKQIGDSFLCVFAEPSAAVLFAIEFLRTLHLHRAELSDGGYRLKVRIGVHMGQVAMEKVLQPDVFGGHVNRAARIEAAATAGLVLTSRAVFENTIGWLKKDADQRIAHGRLGRVKLKGIGEPEEIYGFYPAELPAPALPELVRVKRRRQAALAVLIATCAVAFTVVRWKADGSSQDSPRTPGTALRPLYVQFDLDTAAVRRYSGLDPVSLRASLLTEAITTLHPYRVIDEETLSRTLATKGRFLEHREVNGTLNRSYFQDTLGLGGVLSVTWTSDPRDDADSAQLDLHLVLFDGQGTSSSRRAVTALGDKVASRFSGELRAMYLSATTWVVQARVTTVQNGRLAFVLDSGSLLVKGTPVRLMREYQGLEGYRRRAMRIEEILAYYRAIGERGIMVQLKSDSTEWAGRETREIGAMAFGIEVEGQVLEVFDSTGVARWWRTQMHPDRPEPGDLIYLKY